MKKIIILLLVIVGVPSLYAQQESQYTQYMYNTMTLNPGYTGTRDAISILGIYRTQWVGLDGAPKTTSVSVAAPINPKGDGLGLTIENDRIGPADETTFSASYAYALHLRNNIILSLGIKAGGTSMKVDYDKLKIYEPDNQLEGVLSKFSPNIGAGAFLYTEKWYVGISAPNILETKFYDDIKRSVASEKMHFYLIGGYVFDVSDDVKFKPATLIKRVNGSPLSVDLSANFFFNDKFTLGAAYRVDASLSALAGFNITEGLHIGYAYDYDTHNLGRYNSGSHEIFLRFEIMSTVRRSSCNCPRYF